MINKTRIFSAPLQGYTEASWRHFHATIYGGVDCYFTPFVRIEKGEVRRRDMRDLTSPLNDGVTVIPQIIFGNADEFSRLTDAIAKAGYNHVDMNLGCPFPPQVNRGKGAGMLIHSDILETIAKKTESYPEIEFSAKMRLGVTASSQWHDAMDVISAMRLTHLTIHPRYAAQQYKGETDLEEMDALIKTTSHPIVYNGDITTPAEAAAITDRFPNLYAIMIGRGLLRRPSLAAEITAEKEWPIEQRIKTMKTFHDRILDQYQSTLCGDTQILSKIKPFWDYAEDEIRHKAAKAIKKAGSLTKYLSAIENIH